MKTLVIVGGGIVSIFSALYARKKFDRIIILEKSDKVGGLLASFQLGENNFDYGTHIPGFTGDIEIDNLLYGTDEEINKKWHRFPYLMSENFFSGSWYQSSPLVNVKSLGQDLYLKALSEILKLPKTDFSKDNLDEYLSSSFGETISNHIYRPIFRKLLGEEIENLHVECLRIFGLQRVILLNSESTVELKKLPEYDSKIGFHSYKEGSPVGGYVYPKGFSGIGTWADMLLEKALNQNIEINYYSTVKVMNVEHNTIKSLELNDGTIINCNYILWALPAALAVKNLNVDFKKDTPKFRTTSLFHFQFDQPLLKKIPQYLLCWDPKYISYRITLYPNISNDRTKTSNASLTVEVLYDESIEKKLNEVSLKIISELKELEIIPISSKIIVSKYEYLGTSFPILSQRFINNCKDSCSFLENSYSNFKMIGRHSGKAFFINDTLLLAKKILMEHSLC
ncbi:NAD(P)-binding protein [Leptospira noguchii]|uniref:NAD(P)-binding protein n=1 Tax=Leptospira noguchii TaxID=28182 RepID=UPI0002488453|nr:NAD(P)-binding protein [Leptospira noguchii]EKR74200.1 NAD(P)-binding Rossmann-like domain protein [Leptospira noguchii str. 2006001870]EMS83159.1 NAD(P)-binding Rossmann-like domain protein [Leptospira noguchii str. Hook]